MRADAREIAGHTSTDVTVAPITLRGQTYPNAVLDFRRGFDRHREVSVQILGALGASLTAKALVLGGGDPGAPAMTASLGGGYEYGRSRALLHGGLVRSWQGGSGATRYLGVQGLFQPPWLMGMWTGTRKAWAAGALLGSEFGSPSRPKAFEVAVFHSESALDPGRHGLLIQPSLTFRGRPKSRQPR